MHRFKELRVWQAARELTKDVYMVSRVFPEEEKFGLQSQIRRASCSIMLSIAEGAGRNGDKDFARFLDIAAGSANEVESAAIIAMDQEYIEEEVVGRISEKVESIRNMVFRFQETLRKE